MATTFTTRDVDRVAALARIELTADERELFARQLDDILGYAAQVLAVDTTAVSPTAYAGSTVSALRDDQPVPSLDRDTILREAPDADFDAGLFRVPRVLG